MKKGARDKSQDSSSKKHSSLSIYTLGHFNDNDNDNDT